jgi:LysM repeat protein
MVKQYKYKKIAILLLVVIMCVSVANVFANDKTDTNNGQYILVSVSSGDSVWNIATRYNNDKKDIRELIYFIRKINGLNNNAEIHPGQILKIPVQV